MGRCWYNLACRDANWGSGNSVPWEHSKPAAAPSYLLELGQACADHHTLPYEIQKFRCILATFCFCNPELCGVSQGTWFTSFRCF